MSAKWPNWFPGLALGVEHLVGLEDYILARIGMSDACNPGVEYLDWQASVSLQNKTGAHELTLRGPIRGVTPGGQPVIVEAGQAETVSLNASDQGEFALDIAIEIRPQDPNSRVQVKAVRVSADASPVKCNQADSLYLGRFLFQGGNKKLLKKPLLRHLSALRPPDEDWTRGFVTQLTEVSSRLEYEARSGSRGASMAVAALADVAFDWPLWALPTLARRLRQTMWLASGQTAPQFISEVVSSIPTFPPRDVVGDEIPKLLTDLLVLPTTPRGLPDLLDQLLSGIYLRVPIGEFVAWDDHLNRHHANLDINLVVRALRSRLKERPLDGWSRAIGLITMAKLAKVSRNEWPADVARGYLSNSKHSLVHEIVDSLGKLYRNEAQTAPAGPLAFYLLAKACLGLISTAQDHEDFGRYFVFLGENGSGVSPNLPKDRVFDFLVKRTGLLGDASKVGSHGSRIGQQLIPTIQSQRLRTKSQIRVHVLGGNSSGKSALIREYISLIESATAQPGSGTFGRVSRATDDEHVASFQIGSSRINVVFTEHSVEPPMGSDRTPFSTPINDECDVAVLVIGPESIDVEPNLRPIMLFNSLIWACRGLKKREPLSVIVIYNKSDEYGALTPDNVQVVVSAANWPHSKDWAAFVETITSSGRDPKWNESRKVVLNQTRELWLELSSERDIALSGFFVAADPRETEAKFGVVDSLNAILQ